MDVASRAEIWCKRMGNLLGDVGGIYPRLRTQHPKFLGGTIQPERSTTEQQRRTTLPTEMSANALILLENMRVGVGKATHK
jgi:hypothetical protein